MSDTFPAPMMAGRYHVTTMVPGVDGTGITTAEKTQLVNDVAGMLTSVDVMAALRFDPDGPAYGAVRGPVSAAQRTANTAAINLASSDALAAGGTLVIKGTYEIDGTIRCDTYMDARDGRLEVFDQNISPVLQIGEPVLGLQIPSNKVMFFPAVIQKAKVSGGGWPGNDLGVRISNAHHCEFHAQQIGPFKRGLLEHANGSGNVYNTIFIGFMDTNFIGLDVQAENGGWVNQNVHISGRFYVRSNEGTTIPGARHVRIERFANSSDNITFIGTSLEGEGPEYLVENGGRWILFSNCRWEVRGTYGPRILGLTGSHNLVIDEGYYAERLTIVGVSPMSQIRSAQKTIWTSSDHPNGMLILTHTGNAPAIAIMPGGAAETIWSQNPATAWRWRLGADGIEGKATADTQARIRLAATSGQIQMGPGNAAADTYLIREGVGHMRTGGGGVFEASIMKIGTNWYWTDSAGMLRKHTAKPPSTASTSVGTVIG